VRSTRVKRADVRVRQLRDRARLAVEPPAELRIGGKGLGQDLDRDRAVEARVARTIHLTHSAGANRGDDLVRSEPCSGDQSHFCLLTLNF